VGRLQFYNIKIRRDIEITLKESSDDPNCPVAYFEQQFFTVSKTSIQEQEICPTLKLTCAATTREFELIKIEWSLEYDHEELKGIDISGVVATKGDKNQVFVFKKNKVLNLLSGTNLILRARVSAEEITSKQKASREISMKLNVEE